MSFDNTFLFFKIMMAIILRQVRNRRNRRSRQLSPRQESDDIRWPASSFRCAPTHCHFSRSSTADAFVRSSFLAVSDLLSRPSSRRPLHFQSSPLLVSGPRARLIKIRYKCNKSLASFSLMGISSNGMIRFSVFISKFLNRF